MTEFLKANVVPHLNLAYLQGVEQNDPMESVVQNSNMRLFIGTAIS